MIFCEGIFPEGVIYIQYPVKYKNNTLYLFMVLTIILIIFLNYRLVSPPTEYPLLHKGQTLSLYFDDSLLYTKVDEEDHSLQLHKDRRIFDVATGDVTKDGNEEIILLIGDRNSRFAEELVIYQLDLASQEKYRRIYTNNIALIRPWMVKTCELNGDDKVEIFIGVNKSTYYYKEIENRPFFFNFTDGFLVKKWTGSKFRAPYKEIFFEDLNNNGRDEVIVVEEAEGGYRLAVYYWFGFGFILQGESTVFEDITDLQVIEENSEKVLKIKVKSKWGPRWTTLEASTEKTENDVYFLKERGH